MSDRNIHLRFEWKCKLQRELTSHITTSHVFFHWIATKYIALKVNYFNFDKLTSRNNSTFTSKTHTILYIRLYYIKGKQEQCRGKFEDVFMDLRQVSYNDQDLHKCLPALWLNDNVINNFLQEETRKKAIAIVSTRFFADVKSKRISAEDLKVTILNEHFVFLSNDLQIVTYN